MSLSMANRSIEFEDSTLSIHKRKITRYGNSYSFTTPEIVSDAPDAFVAPDGLSALGGDSGCSLIRPTGKPGAITTTLSKD